MDASNISSVIAVVVAIAALAVSVWAAQRQTRLQRESNHMPVILEIVDGFRSPAFQADYDYIRTKLQVNYTPSVGISGLPLEVRRKLFNVCYLFHAVAFICALEAVDERVLIAGLGGPARIIWKQVEPYSIAERAAGNADQTFQALEKLAERAAAYPADNFEIVMQEWLRRRLPRRKGVSLLRGARGLPRVRGDHLAGGKRQTAVSPQMPGGRPVRRSFETSDKRLCVVSPAFGRSLSGGVPPCARDETIQPQRQNWVPLQVVLGLLATRPAAWVKSRIVSQARGVSLPPCYAG